MMIGDLEEFEDSLSEEERTAFRSHAFSRYTLAGQHLPHPYETDDLLAVLGHRECYVVDTNSNWKAESRKPENREKAFILPRTLSDEEADIKGLFFGPKVETTNNNLFILGVDHTEDEPVIAIERLDRFYRSIMDESSLLEESRPRGLRTDAKFLNRERRWMEIIQQEKQAILLILGVRDISKLAMPKDMSEKRTQLLAFIRREAPKCRADFVRSIGVARHCYALLLIEDRQIRTEFSKPDYRNVLGDTFVLHNALFLQAKILSGDKPLKRMASYAGRPCLGRVL
jgi:hypothetical protein